jgi:hypothetical protein
MTGARSVPLAGEARNASKSLALNSILNYFKAFALALQQSGNLDAPRSNQVPKHLEPSSKAKEQMREKNNCHPRFAQHEKSQKRISNQLVFLFVSFVVLRGDSS